MQHPETLPPEILRQMGIKELRQRKEFLEERIASYTFLVRSAKSMIANLPATIDELERDPLPSDFRPWKAASLASYY